GAAGGVRYAVSDLELHDGAASTSGGGAGPYGVGLEMIPDADFDCVRKGVLGAGRNWQAIDWHRIIGSESRAIERYYFSAAGGAADRNDRPIVMCCNGKHRGIRQSSEQSGSVARHHETLAGIRFSIDVHHQVLVAGRHV